VTQTTWYQDADGDGFGNPATSQVSCDPLNGYVLNNSDCSDADSARHPGASEYCNGMDDDCDGNIDESDAVDASTWFADFDHDGYGDPNSSVVACNQPDFYVADSTDCDDANEFIYPGSGCGGCTCECHGDPGACNGLRDIVDVVQCVNVAFRNFPPVLDPNANCPYETTDVNCSGDTEVVDVVKMVTVAFRNGNPATEFCDPCP
jgi:hypothetical protein